MIFAHLALENLPVQPTLVLVNVFDVFVQIIDGLLQAAIARRVVSHDRGRLVWI